MQKELNTEPRELSIEDLDNAAGGLNINQLPAIASVIAGAALIRGFIGAVLRMF
jgi:hypothetical protein